MSIIIETAEGEINKKFKGSGTKEDPIFIDPSVNLPDRFEIFESNQYVIMKNCNLNYLGLYCIENFIIENCKFEKLEIYNSNNNEIKNSEISHSVLIQSNNCQIENCIYNQEFYIFNSHKNRIKNCIFKLFRNPDYLSRENIFEDNEIHEKDLKQLKDIDAPLKDEKKTYVIEGLYGWSLLKCKGVGTKEDPIIIGPQEKSSDVIHIQKNSKYLILENFNPDHLVLYDCKKITIKNCTFKSITFHSCSNIKVNNILTKLIKLGTDLDITIENSNIWKVKILKYFDKSLTNITFKNCLINHLEKNFINTFNFDYTTKEFLESDKSLTLLDLEIVYRIIFVIGMFILGIGFIIVGVILNSAELIVSGFLGSIIFSIIGYLIADLFDKKRKKKRQQWLEEQTEIKTPMEKASKLKKKKSKLIKITSVGFLISLLLWSVSFYIFPYPIAYIVATICSSCFLIFIYLLTRHLFPFLNWTIGVLFIIIGISILYASLYFAIFYAIPSLIMIVIGILYAIDGMKFDNKNKR